GRGALRQRDVADRRLLRGRLDRRREPGDDRHHLLPARQAVLGSDDVRDLARLGDGAAVRLPLRPRLTVPAVVSADEDDERADRRPQQDREDGVRDAEAAPVRLELPPGRGRKQDELVVRLGIRGRHAIAGHDSSFVRSTFGISSLASSSKRISSFPCSSLRSITTSAMCSTLSLLCRTRWYAAMTAAPRNSVASRRWSGSPNAARVWSSCIAPEPERIISCVPMSRKRLRMSSRTSFSRVLLRKLPFRSGCGGAMPHDPTIHAERMVALARS